MPAADGMDDILIEELELGVRSYNCLKRAGVQTIGDLVQKSENELSAIPNFGRKSIEEVKETLRVRGLGLRDDELGSRDDAAPEEAEQALAATPVTARRWSRTSADR